jgi:sugar phosphate isomerase/epimerase
MALWFSSGAFNATDMAGLLNEARTLGIQGIELSSGLRCSDEELKLVHAEHAAASQRFLVHNYFPAPAKPFVLNIAALDEESLQASKQLARTALMLARDLGAPFYSVHAGFAARLRAEQLGKPKEQAASLSAADIDRVAAYAAMIDNVRELADFAATLGVSLLIENNVISPLYLERMPINPLLLTEGKEICRFFDDLHHPNVGLLLDVAHAKVSATALGFDADDFVDQVAPHVRCLHLSDNNGREDSNQPFGDDAWFVPRLTEFRHCEVVVEAYRLKPQVMLSQLEFLQRIYQ